MIVFERTTQEPTRSRSIALRSGAVALLIGGLCVTAVAGPQALSVVPSTGSEPVSLIAATGSDTNASISFSSLDADWAEATSIASPLHDILPEAIDPLAVGRSDFPLEQPPMIPLPPAVWAGLAGVAGIAFRIVRPKQK